MEENREKSLKDIFRKQEGYVSDKWELYLEEYDKLFEGFRDKPIALLEIGVQNGGSLEIWSRYFHKDSIIVGLDIDEKCAQLKYENPNIKVIIGDATKPEIIEVIRKESGVESFDVIIDDGSHTSEDIIKAFCNLFPILKIGGLYIVEDLHCSYFKAFGGGLQKSLSSIEFLKNLVDIVNYEHWRLNIPRSLVLKDFFRLYSTDLNDLELAKIHSIKFLNSLCIIEKDSLINNRLGKRFVVGKYAEVSQTINPQLLNGSLISDLVFEGEYNQTKLELEQEKTSLQKKVEELEIELHNFQSQLESERQEKTSLQKKVEELEIELHNFQSQLELERQEKVNLQQKITQLEDELVKIYLSKSWRITKPLRWLRRKLKI
jgi:hypothetical protein